MIAAELFTQKLQALLGKNYEVQPFHIFDQRYAQPAKGAFGGYTVEYQYGEKKDIILTAVQTNELNPTITQYYNFQGTYTIQFHVPVDILKLDQDGILLEDPAYNFFDDFERVRQAFKNAITYEYGGENYKGFATISEPSFVGSEPSSGQRRVIYQVTGQLTISDSRVGYGGDRKVFFVFENDTEIEVENLSGYSCSSSSSGNAFQPNNKTRTEEYTTSIGQIINFTVDEVDTSNRAYLLIADKEFLNPEFLSPHAEPKQRRRKVHVKIYKKDVLKTDFWGLLSVVYSNAGIASPGRYQITISNSQDE